MMKRLRTTKRVDLKWKPLALLALVCIITLSGASSASQPGDNAGVTAADTNGTPAEVKIDNFAFTPGAITVKAGTRVTWVNRDDIPHTVDSTQGKFKSAALDTDDKFQFLFTEPGEYPFYCRIHPKMTGKIVVQP
jgi:plastocyanin